MELLRNAASNIVVLDMPEGIDVRRSMVKGSIVIPELWADRWDRVMEFEPKGRLALVLEALLKTIIVHQLAHWLADIDAPHSLLDGCRLLSLSATAKPVRPELKENSGSIVDSEPGDYVEMRAGGGMTGFDDSRDDGVSMFVLRSMQH
jgi:hypothetical protein